MGFRAHNPKRGPLGMLSILNWRSLRKRQKQEEPSDLPLFSLFPWNGSSEISRVKNAFLGPEGRRHSYQLRRNLGQEMCVHKPCETPLSPWHLYHLLSKPRLLCLVISLQFFISLPRSLLFWLILWIFILSWGLPWTCKNSMKVVYLWPLNISSPGQFSDPAKDPNGVKENISFPTSTWRFGQQISHWSCLLGAQNSKFMSEKIWDMWKVPPWNPI